MSAEWRERLEVGPAPRGGNSFTLNQTGGGDNQSAGASFRILVDTGDWDLTLGMNNPGQGGHPDHPHYADLFELWARDRFHPVQTLLHVLRLIRIRHPAELKFQESFFDQLVGNRWIRGMLMDKASGESIVERWKIDLEGFKQKRKGFLLY